MKPGTISATIFAAASVAAALVSSRIFGAGMWGTLMVIGGTFVGISAQFPRLTVSGHAIALLASVLCLLATGFGLLATTISGGFSLSANQGLLLCLLFAIAASGISYFRSRPRERAPIGGRQP